MSRGGGVGINWSVLRPSGAHLARVSGTTSGPVGWMQVGSVTTGTVEQGGSRRGAAMFMLNDWHPDVMAFMEAKVTAGMIENANCSVAVSNEFMEAVDADAMWVTRFPDTTHPAYNSEWDGDIKAWEAKGYPVKEYGKFKARDLWAKLAEFAWRSGEPGVVFLDRYNDQSTANGQEKIICVNPCGEQGLGAYSVCNLGSMNLSAYVLESGHFDVPAFAHDVRVAIRFLDNVIDKTYYHLPETRAQQMKLRRIGLGVMGLADALIKMKIRYGSSKAVAFVDEIWRLMKDVSIEESMRLAEERGPAEGWRDDMWERPFLAEYGKRYSKRGALRNLFLLTQAPTGTTAGLAGVNSGIEPYFAFKFTRVDRTGTHEPATALQREWMGMKEAGSDIPDYWVESGNVTGREHLVMQATAQKWIDSSISKTVNLPKDATVEQVAEVYNLAWDLGCKGLAVYRDGSRDKQVLYKDEPAEVLPSYSAHPGKNGFDTPALPMIAFAQSSSECPLDGGTIIHQEGCQKCSTCSWSAC
jgi:ribonucleoside-diphosphate reductase alpha chain